MTASSHSAGPYLPHVDPFLGTEAVELPVAEGIASTWFYLKAQIGNTHPGATLPFSPVTAAPYSGAYPTGYGLYDVNSHGKPAKLVHEKRAYGITHVHPFGTGYIASFYNYLLVIPFTGTKPSVPALDLRRTLPGLLMHEEASTGYHRGWLDDDGIGFELTVTRHAAAHRYHFPQKPHGLLVDITSGGLAPLRAQARPSSARVRIESDGTVGGDFVFYGVRWFFALCCHGSQASLWRSSGTSPAILADRVLELSSSECETSRAGVLFRTGTRTELYVGLSVESRAAALNSAITASESGFENLQEMAAKSWEDHLGRLRVESESGTALRKFYTAVYHAMQKPVKSESSNFLWTRGPTLYCDFATMWDQYKTQLPFVFAFCPEHRLPIVQSLLAVGKAVGFPPAAVLFSNDFKAFSDQSRGLTSIVVKDAFDCERAMNPKRSIPKLWSEVADLLVEDLRKTATGIEPDRTKNGYSHLVDISIAGSCIADLARALGRPRQAAVAMAHADLWKRAFDPQTGLMREGDYYEAAHSHYSFRIIHAMSERIEIAGGAAGFLAQLDRFFGFGEPAVEQLADPPWDESLRAGIVLGRFDGLNNEVMLETPFAYHYIGRPDRTAEVVDGVLKTHFGGGHGGLPGNDDSGALSAWYVWASIGLFPIAGQSIFLICPPSFPRISIKVGNATFEIETGVTRAGAQYLASVRLNGVGLDRSFLTYTEVLGGGTLRVELCDDPKAFRPSLLPPGAVAGQSATPEKRDARLTQQFRPHAL